MDTNSKDWGAGQSVQLARHLRLGGIIDQLAAGANNVNRAYLLPLRASEGLGSDG